MKTITTLGGQEIIILTRRKTEVRSFFSNLNYTVEDWNNGFWDPDATLYIEYQDGTSCYISDSSYEGKVKLGKIKTLIYGDAWGDTVYGEYHIINIDDIEEEYSSENDSEDKTWTIS